MSNEVAERRIGGILIISVCITILLSGFFASKAISLTFSADNIITTMNALVKNSGYHYISIAFDFISYILTVLVAGAFYLIFSHKNRLLSLFGALCFLSSGIILSYHDIGNFILPEIAQAFENSSPSSQVIIQDIFHSLLLTEIWGVKVGFTFFALGLFFFSISFIGSKNVSKFFTFLGIFASVSTLFGLYISFTGPMKDVIAFASYMPTLVWEIGLGISLIRTQINKG